jgi:hypothetical protein
MAATFTARPTIYNGIQMRSRLEAGFAAWLDRVGIDWAYEPVAFGHPEHGQYLPDFELRDVPVSDRPGETLVYVEVKPLSYVNFYPSSDESDPGLAPYLELNRMAHIVAHSRPDAVLVLAQPPRPEAQYAEVSPLLWEPIGVHMFWPMQAYWTEIQGRMGIAWPCSQTQGPWWGDWWKGATT